MSHECQYPTDVSTVAYSLPYKIATYYMMATTVVVLQDLAVQAQQQETSERYHSPFLTVQAEDYDEVYLKVQGGGSDTEGKGTSVQQSGTNTAV